MSMRSDFIVFLYNLAAAIGFNGIFIILSIVAIVLAKKTRGCWIPFAFGAVLTILAIIGGFKGANLNGSDNSQNTFNLVLFILLCTLFLALIDSRRKRAIFFGTDKPKEKLEKSQTDAVIKKYGEERGQLILNCFSELHEECGYFNDHTKTCIYDFSPSFYNRIEAEHGQAFANEFNSFFEKNRYNTKLIHELVKQKADDQPSSEESALELANDAISEPIQVSEVEGSASASISVPAPAEEKPEQITVPLNKAEIEPVQDTNPHECYSEFQKARSLLIMPTKENINSAYLIVRNLAEEHDYLPAINWMAEYSESVLGDYKQAMMWYKKAAAISSKDKNNSIPII